jgi:hypothetical protein
MYASRREVDDEHGVVRDNARHVQTSVVKKSAAAIAPQWARRNVCQFVGRWGTGCNPDALSIRAMVERPTSWPRFFNAP